MDVVGIGVALFALASGVPDRGVKLVMAGLLALSLASMTDAVPPDALSWGRAAFVVVSAFVAGSLLIDTRRLKRVVAELERRAG